MAQEVWTGEGKQIRGWGGGREGIKDSLCFRPTVKVGLQEGGKLNSHTPDPKGSVDLVMFLFGLKLSKEVQGQTVTKPP